MSTERDGTVIEIEFNTPEEAAEFTAAADEMGMSEGEYVLWLFEKRKAAASRLESMKQFALSEPSEEERESADAD